MRRLAVVSAVVALAGVLAAAASAAVLGVASGRIAVFSKTLTHNTCTLPSTSVSDDTYNDENNPNTKHDTSGTLSISPRTNRRRYAWIRFDLTACALPTGAQVDSATLSVRMTTQMSGRTISVGRVNGAWTEAALDWSPQPPVAAATDTFSGTGTGLKTVDVGPDVADWVSGAATNYGWQLADLGAATNVTGAIGSSDGTAANRPTLTIAYAS